MEPHIQPLVRVLNEAGLFTVGSCEGHHDRKQSYPWVLIDHKASHPLLYVALAERIADYNLKNHGTLLEWTLHPNFAQMYGKGGLYTYLRPFDRGYHRSHLKTIQMGIAKFVEHLQSTLVLYKQKPPPR